MTVASARRRAGLRMVATVAIAGALVAAGVAWFGWRAQPDAVAMRFVDAVHARFRAASIDSADADLPRIQFANGIVVDVRLAPLADACGRRWIGCGDAIDGAVRDVDRVVAAAAAPSPELLRPVVVAEATPGYRLGYVTEPLVQPLELRYALVVGLASTFVTPTIAGRLRMTTVQLRASAVAWLGRERDVALERLDAAGPGDPPLYRVRADGDPVASLVDGERLRRFATQLGTRRLVVAVPARGVLYVAAGDAAGLRALRARVRRPSGAPPKPGETGVLAYDVDAPAAARWSFPPAAA